MKITQMISKNDGYPIDIRNELTYILTKGLETTRYSNYYIGVMKDIPVEYYDSFNFNIIVDNVGDNIGDKYD